MLQIIQIVARTKATTIASTSDAKFHNAAITESTEQLNDIGLDGWTGEAGEDMLLDGPTYGEYHDDLVGDVDEDTEV